MVGAACRCAIAAACIALAATDASAQPDPAFHQLDVPGIAGARVSAVARDARGLLWIGTDRGLRMYDGAATRAYVSDPMDERSLPDDKVHHLAVDSAGWLMASTFKGLWLLSTRQPLQHMRARFAADGGSRTELECFSTLAAPGGAIYAFCGRMGAFVRAPGDSLFRPLAPGALERPVGGLLMPDGGLWVADRQQLVELPAGSDRAIGHPVRFAHGGPPIEPLLIGLHHDPSDPARIIARSWGLGLLVFDTRAGEWRGPVARDGALSHTRNVAHALAPSPHGLLAVLDDGLFAFDPAALRLRGLQAPEGGATFIAGDASGTVLLGGEGRLHALCPVTIACRKLPGAMTAASSCLAVAAEGPGYWLTRYYDERGLFRIDTAGAIVERHPLPDAQAQPFLVLESPGWGVLIGTNRGLFRLPRGGRAIEPVPLPGDDPAAGINSLCRDAEGRIWLARGRAGCTVLAADRPAVFGHYDAFAIASADADAALHLAPADDGGVLLAMASGALARLHARAPRGERLPIAAAARPLLGGITGLVGLADGGVLLLLRHQGVCVLRRAADGAWAMAAHLRPGERPIFDQGLRDGQGRVWLSSDRGGFVFDPASAALHRMDGLHGVPFKMVGFLRDGGGALLAQCADGWWAADPASYRVPQEGPRLVVHAARLGRADADGEAVLSGITLHPGQPVFLEFGVAAPFEGDAYSYRYRLEPEGDTAAWSALGKSRSLTLSDLHPGRYTLRMEALSELGPAARLAIGLEQLAPWYARWWAVALWLALGSAGVALLTRRLVRARYQRRLRALEREREVERVRRRVSSDLHDGLGAELTRISLMARRLGRDGSPEAAAIAEASDELIAELGDLVWAVEPRNDSAASFLAYLRHRLNRMFEASAMALEADLQCDPALMGRAMDPELKRNLLMIVKECANNALRHSGGRSLRIALRIGARGAQLTVSDDGRGFDPERVRPHAKGLRNLRKRAAAMGAMLAIDATPQGTRISLEAPPPKWEPAP